LAHHLRAQGVGPDVLVALMVERGLEMIVGMLAILKAGGAYVPLDPAYPADRLQYMLSHSQSPVILTQAALVERLPEHSAQVFRLDADWEQVTAQPTTNPPRTVLPDHIAYIIFTSGSTGRPKGVMVKQQGLINLVHGLRAYFDDPAVEITGLITSISFDSSVNQIFPTLIFGRTLHIIPDAVKFNSRALLRYLDENQIHLLDAVPSYMQAVLNEVAPEQPANALRYLLIGGEKIEQRLLQSVFGQFGSTVEIINIYGLTEISDINILGPIRAADIGKPITVGQPLQNNRIYILDAFDQPQPIGIAGEVCVTGESVSRGYLFRPELTAERFVVCPFEDGQIMVRTGDLGRWRDDGTVEILGRIDHQVKIRGFRIETAEIEHALAQYPSVNECVVVVREDEPGDKRLVGYLAPREGMDEPSSAELRQLLGSQLPEYMVPAAFVTLPALPKTPSGKIDRKALPVPELQSEIDAAFVAPTTPIEELLAQIWADVLGVERLGTRSNFFDLGGHSLLGTQIVSRIRESFGVELPLRVIFEAPTVVELAARIEAARGATSIQQAPPIQPVEWSGPLPLSFAQQRLWLLDQFEPNTATYNIPAAVRLRGTLDLAALERTLTTIIERQTSLRTTFKSVDGQSVQVIGPVPFLPLPLIDLRSLPETMREAEAQRMTGEEALRPFDLQYGPLCRFTVLRLDDHDHMLLVTMHHIISDGWSISVFVRELTALYSAFVNNRESPLADLPVQYTDYAIWQRQWLQGEILDQQLGYWRQRLAGAPPVLELPTDWPRPAVRTVDGASIHVSLPADLSSQLRALSRREGTTLFMTLLAAFKVLLARSASQDDIVVGTPIAGRNRAETENLIGFFLNTLVLRTDTGGDPSFKELLGRVRETTLDAYAHQDVPFEKLLDELHPERDLSYTPLFQVFFNMLNLPDMRVELPNLTAETLASAEIGSKFDLTLYAQEQSETIELTLVYNANLFRESRMQELSAQFELLLAQIAATPTASIHSYSLVTPSAQPLLPSPAEPLDATWYGAVHTMFAQQAERGPDRVALIDPLGSWSYAELNARANQIAHSLIDGGIQPEDVVAIYSYRSAALVCAILGVLKAGAAYTILDPAYPTSRLIDYLQVAQPRGWIQLESAGDVPEALAEFMDAQRYCCRLTLPYALQTTAHAELDAQPATNPEVEIGPDNAAIIGFTSGSTGKPKGIVARHGPLTHFLPWLQQTFGLSENDRYSMISGLAHDPLQRDMFTPLCSGATVCVPQPEDIVTPGRLAQWMQQHAITIAHLTPALGQLLTETAAEKENGDHQIPSLRYAFIVGDVLTMRDVARIRSLAPGVTCVNFYGSTETQRAVGYYLIPTSDDRPQTATSEQVRAKEILPLGRGMKDVQVLVLTAGQQIAGIGEVGEIYMRSPHLARGYIGDEQLTRERFLSNPFTSIAGDRLYRTGDLGRYRPDGNVEFVGRADHQVKIRGFRIELGEIEAVLGQHESVREAVVIAREDTPGNKRLVAYIVGQPETTPVVADLRRFLQERLPNYMIPAAFVLLEALPLTPNGKVDRRALPKPDGAHRDGDAAYVAPETQLEQTIAAIWQEVLEIEMVGMDDNFFDIGGSSIHVVQVHGKLQSALNRDLPILDMFKYPTIGSLAKHLSQDQPEQASFQDIHERARKQKAAMERQKQLRSRS
ncbi:MAG TPA: amino acid adenylation domain-containing protein, partial [Herpetosiphonaceae bacterium]